MTQTLTEPNESDRAWREIRCPFCRRLYLKIRGQVDAVELEGRCRCKTQFLVSQGKLKPVVA